MHKSNLATLLQAMYNFFEDKGLDADALFRQAELDPGKLYDADARFPIYGMHRIWAIAEQETNSPTIIYEVMPYIEPRMLHAIGHAWLVSRNLLEALERFVRYHRMLSNNIEVSLESSPTVVKLSGRALETAGELRDEGVLAFALQVCKKSYGHDLIPLEVSLRRSKPKNTRLIDKFYGCPINYDFPGENNEIVFDIQDMSRRLMNANPEIAMVMESVITGYLERVDANDIASRVRRCVAKMLIYSEPSKQELADELNMAPRTLQRRLEEQGSSVKEIIDDTRHHLALEYLAQDHYSIKEVAFNLGFSDPSNFARAFKRWEGITPKEFRAQN